MPSEGFLISNPMKCQKSFLRVKILLKTMAIKSIMILPLIVVTSLTMKYRSLTVEELNSISPVRHRPMTSLRTDSQRLLVASKPISRRAIERAHVISFLDKEVSCVARKTRPRTAVLEETVLKEPVLEELDPLRKLLLRKVM